MSEETATSAPSGDEPVVSSPAPTKDRKRNPLVVIAALLAAMVVIVVVYKMGLPPDEPELPPNHPDITMPTAPPIDARAVDELEDRLKADPADADAMRALANLYFEGRDYVNATLWFEALTVTEPNDVEAHLTYGVSLFNLGDIARAEQQWTTVIELDPSRVEAYYNLGFAHLSKTPADVKAASAAWHKVIELDPDSDLAANARVHLDSMSANTTPSED